MKHFYKKINGYMTDKNTVMFDKVFEKLKENNIWIELGSWTGKSTAYCVVELINQNKLGQFYCVDTWKGGPEHQDLDLIKQDTLFDTFKTNINPIIDYINIERDLSWNVANKFENNSVDFCYVDADHSYESVVKDLNAWWPKVKSGGIFAGDDFTKGFPGVVQAVKEFTNKHQLKYTRIGRCWYIEKD